MFKRSYISRPYTNLDLSKVYAFGKINGLVMSDVDKNGFMDLITFPSNFTEPVAFKPLVWLNQKGQFNVN